MIFSSFIAYCNQKLFTVKHYVECVHFHYRFTLFLRQRVATLFIFSRILSYFELEVITVKKTASSR